MFKGMEDGVNFFDLLPDDVVDLILVAVLDCKSLIRCMAVCKYFKTHCARVSSLSIESPGYVSSYDDKLHEIYSMVKSFHSLESLTARVGGNPKDEPPAWARCMRYVEIGTSVEKFVFMAAKSGEFSDLEKVVKDFNTNTRFGSEDFQRQRDCSIKESTNKQRTCHSEAFSFTKIDAVQRCGGVEDSSRSYGGNVLDFTLRQVIAPTNNVLRRMVPVIVFAIVQGLDEFREKVPSFIEKLPSLNRFLFVDLRESVTVYMREDQIQDVRVQLLKDLEIELNRQETERIVKSENLEAGKGIGGKEDFSGEEKSYEKQNMLPNSSSSYQRNLKSGSQRIIDTWNEDFVETGRDYKEKGPDFANKHNQTKNRFYESEDAKKLEKGKGRMEEENAEAEDNISAKKEALSRAESEVGGCKSQNFWHKGESSSSYYSQSISPVAEGSIGSVIRRPLNNLNKALECNPSHSRRDGIDADHVKVNGGVEDGEVTVESKEALKVEVADSNLNVCRSPLQLYPDAGGFQKDESRQKSLLKENLESCSSNRDVEALASVNDSLKYSSGQINDDTTVSNACDSDGGNSSSSSINCADGSRDTRPDSLWKCTFKKTSKSDALRFKETERFVSIGDKIKERLDDGLIKWQGNRLNRASSFWKKEENKGLKTCRLGLEDDDTSAREIKTREYKSFTDKDGMNDQQSRSIHGSWFNSQADAPESSSGKVHFELSRVPNLGLKKWGTENAGPLTVNNREQSPFSTSLIFMEDGLSSNTLNSPSLAPQDKLERSEVSFTQAQNRSLDKLALETNLHLASQSEKDTIASKSGQDSENIHKQVFARGLLNLNKVSDMSQENETCKGHCLAGNNLALEGRERSEHDQLILEGTRLTKEQHLTRNVNRGTYQTCPQPEEKGKRSGIELRNEIWRETWKESLEKKVLDVQRVMLRQAELERASLIHRERLRAEAGDGTGGS